ncbi:hypothetical protein IGI04_021735 [Brassica rapa subsp. trilocularis]|uniref:Response regulatory domain-containing protein n=1 Tax=Brassica rapa subsp. trilocularis TaxID=1813537 RepID=A0ABQ7LYX3_BRACM|nr:hypothetical protein IGI04_021735 [Brassica rapa subsp. trilocularis]
MASDGGVSCLRRSEMMSVGIGGIDSPPLDVDEVHVLAVDDSLVDRIVIERLLRITSCKDIEKSKKIKHISGGSVSVTAVDSGWRALEFLGIDNEKASAELDESSSFRQVPVVIMSSENVITRIDRCLEEGAEDFLLKPVKLADVKRLRNYLARDVKHSNGNKRKLPKDSPPLTLSPDSSDSSPPRSTLSPDSSDSSPPPSTLSPDSSDSSSPPLSPVEIFSSPLLSPLDDEVDDVLTSSPESTPSLVRRQKMRSPGLD